MNKSAASKRMLDNSSTYVEADSDVENASLKDEKEWSASKNEWAVMITLAIVSLMVALDATILVPVLPTLALDLHGSTTDAFWAGTSYLLTSAVFQPFIASLSDIFGRKEMLMVSIFLFTLGTLLCAPLAKDFTMLLAGRSVQGIGGGGIITLGQVIYADIIPLRQRPKYFSIVLGAWALGSVAGPLIGGLFVKHLSWRWCFYINFPFCAAGLVLVPCFVRLSTQKSSFLSKLARVDWLGGFLFIGGTATFLIGISWAGVQFSWSSVQTLVPIFIGLAAFTAAIVWESFFAKTPFLTVSLFSSLSAVASYTGAFCNGFILFCALYYIPLYFMAVRLTTPLRSGINLLPVTCFLLPGSILVSVLSSRLGRFRWAIWIGWVITACGCGFLILLDEFTSTEIWATVLAIFGIGSGMVLTSLNVGIQAISKPEEAGRAAAMYAFMRSIGMTIGVAVGGTTFQNVMMLKLKELSLPEEIAKNAEAFIDEIKTMPATDPIRVGTILAYVHGLRGVFILTTGVAAFGLLASTVIRKHSMDKSLHSQFTLKGASQNADLSASAYSSVATFDSNASSAPGRSRSNTQESNDPTCHLRDGSGFSEVDLGPDNSQRVLPPVKRKPVSTGVAVPKPPSVEAYYLFPNGARLPANL